MKLENLNVKELSFKETIKIEGGSGKLPKWAYAIASLSVLLWNSACGN